MALPTGVVDSTQLTPYGGPGLIPIGDTDGNIWLPKGYMQGLELAWGTVSRIMVSPGICRDDTNTGNLVLSSQTVCNITTAPPNGIDRKNLSGVHSVTSGTATCTGTGTAYLTEFGTRTLTGTVSASASTTVTGTGTQFTSELHLGDLIGNAAGGYRSITAITNDTSLTVSSAITVSGSANCIEAPVFRPGPAADIFRVISIASDTSLTVNTNWSTTQTLTSGFACSESISCWYYIWLVGGTAGTATVISTQRTTPYCFQEPKKAAADMSGYARSKRLLGAVWNNSSGDFRFFQMYRANARSYYFTGSANMITAGTATTYTRFSWIDETAPAIADSILLYYEAERQTSGATNTFANTNISFDGANDCFLAYSGNVTNTTVGQIHSALQWAPRGYPGGAGTAPQGRGVPGAWYKVTAAASDRTSIAARGWSAFV